MAIEYSNENKIKEIKLNNITIPFTEKSIYFYVENNGEKEILNSKYNKNQIIASNDFITCNACYINEKDYFCLDIKVKNNKNEIYEANRIGFSLGIDTYMDEYPKWNNKFFSTLLRCEKDYFWGYFMSPKNKTVAVISPNPIASYHYEYNKVWERDFGHRIYSANIDLLSNMPQPERHPENLKFIKPNEELCFKIYYVPMENINKLKECVKKYANAEIIDANKFTYDLNETIEINTTSKVKIISPSGKILSNYDKAFEYGEYKVLIEGEKTSEGSIYCKKPWDFYLKNARTEAINKPQKASTHVETWYGLFSGFLAKKHFPNLKEDEIIENCFNEIMPYMYDLKNGKAIVSTKRIQNIALLISLLVDKYESGNNIEDLQTAVRFADILLNNQNENGAFYCEKVHYTCVIYVAKALLELYDAEALINEDFWQEKAKIHFESVKRAIDDLVLNLENIGTEGEHTLEDGMISCSALQIAFFALHLPENEREKYIKAAEHMISIHRCLEQQFVPDCKQRGATLRFWEAQYDVLIEGNMMNSPHGWSAWLCYGLYYLYLLTKKEEYLTHFMNLISACAQIMDLNGNLRWSFVSDPCVYVKCAVPNLENVIEKTYDFDKSNKKMYGMKKEYKYIGEQYVDMISDWFKIGSQKVTGGYTHCPLILENDFVWVDNQGGCCDNDVHEIFKCIEETVLNKAFVKKRDDNTFLTYNCKVTDNLIIVNDDVKTVIIDSKTPLEVLKNVEIIKL